MSLFKIFRGQKDDLKQIALHDGYSYVAVTDDNAKAATFYTDAPDSNGTVKRYEIGVTEAERDAWNAKQDAITIDETPTKGSSNPVTSDGVKSYVDDSVQDIDGANVTVTLQEEVSILNTDSPALGETVYFRDYPDITWQVQHLDGDYAYLALYPMTEETTFDPNRSTSYSGSTIASKCTDYLNNTIPNVADYLEEVTVNGVTAKVFIPSKAMYETDWDWPKADASNRICQYNGSIYRYWTSTANGSNYVWHVTGNGGFDYSYGYPPNANGFRPAIKVNYRQTIPGTTTKDLNTALDDINASISEKASTPYQTRIAFSTSWQGSDPYTQEVTVEDAAENSRVDLHPMASTLVQLAEDGVSALYVENTNGTFTANSIGGPPSTNMVMLATVTEVEPAGQIPNTMTLSETSITLNSTTKSATFTISGNYDGTVSVSSSDTSVATVSLDGNTVTVSSVNDTTGTATITVNATGGNYTAASKTCTATFFVNPLNTDNPALGETVYFTAYPNITWQVQHLDGNYAYLALYPMTETSTFGSDATYYDSAIASKCATYLSNTIPNVADYLENVAVGNVSAKVFIPSKTMYETDWDWPKADASNRICQLNGSNHAYWTSSISYEDYYSGIWCVRSDDGSFFSSMFAPSSTNGFRPAVKVRYKT